MAIETRNKINTAFSMASMSDLVFLLLIFFMLTSTLVAPNAIKLLLPSSHSKTMAKQSLTVYIDKSGNFYVGENKTSSDALQNAIFSKIEKNTTATIVVRADRSVPVQDVVHVLDVVNQINEKNKTQHKVILATKPQ
ncbi:MAG: biopolymer transporter ExbD [Bacteroidales bacterium]|nr:biopolymer transporter ExbD [Bacteroidales bacterium]